MIAFALSLVIAAPCEYRGLTNLENAQQDNACRLLALPSSGPPERTSGVLPEIYSRPGFEHARQRNSGVFQALIAQLRVWFDKFFESSGAETYSNVTRVVVLALALAIGVTVVVRVISRRRPRVDSTVIPHATNALDLKDPAVHRQRAEALLSTDPRGAIREGWLCVLATLERARFARPDRVKTNRELVSELPARGAPAPLTAAVEALVAWFDHSFYSLDRVEPAEARRFLDDVARLPGPR